MPSQSGIMPTSEAIEAFNEMKLGRTGVKYIIFTIRGGEIVVEETSKEQDFEKFRLRMVGGEEDGSDEDGKPKYAVYDVEYELPGGEGKRSKLCLIRYIPDNTTIRKDKLVYAASYNGLRDALAGLPKEWPVSMADEFTWGNLMDKIK